MELIWFVEANKNTNDSVAHCPTSCLQRESAGGNVFHRRGIPVMKLEIKKLR